jgi:hypothetical protein
MKNLFIAVSIMLLSQTLYASTESPYKGQQLRSIKALSQKDINGYMTGKGMGFAKAAELNHYPGPRHVLDLSELVEGEQKLDQLFAQGSVDKNSLETTLQDIGTTQAKLRNVHLSTHLEQKELLTKHQIMMYDRIRGYGGANGSSGHKHNHEH